MRHKKQPDTDIDILISMAKRFPFMRRAIMRRSGGRILRTLTRKAAQREP